MSSHLIGAAMAWRSQWAIQVSPDFHCRSGTGGRWHFGGLSRLRRSASRLSTLTALLRGCHRRYYRPRPEGDPWKLLYTDDVCSRSNTKTTCVADAGPKWMSSVCSVLNGASCIYHQVLNLGWAVINFKNPSYFMYWVQMYNQCFTQRIIVLIYHILRQSNPQ